MPREMHISHLQPASVDTVALWPQFQDGPPVTCEGLVHHHGGILFVMYLMLCNRYPINSIRPYRQHEREPSLEEGTARGRAGR